MSQWTERILREFPADLTRLWIASDPDGLLLDEQLFSSLRERGFEVLPFGDSVVFRAEFEERYRSAWDDEQDGPAKALVVHLRESNIGDVPWDYLRQAQRVNLTLADLFPKLSYSVVQQIGSEYFEQLYDAQTKHAPQPLGENATKDFILTHLFHFHPHLISNPGDLWRDVLRLRNRNASLPAILADHVAKVLCERAEFSALPVRDLFLSNGILLRIIQDAWCRYLVQTGVVCTEPSEPTWSHAAYGIDIPFDHPDIRATIESMFLDGTLHSVVAQNIPATVPAWMRIGIVPDPDGDRDRVLESIRSLTQIIPAPSSSHREWFLFSHKLSEMLARYHLLDSDRAEKVTKPLLELQAAADELLQQWVINHYADLPSLPAMKAPVMLHHVPRYLSVRRMSGETRIALLIFDGMAFDQWAIIRECVTKKHSKMVFDDGSCFAWVPTLTSVSRQALFSGLKPREFASSINTTAQDGSHWTRFWQDNGLRPNEIMFRKAIIRTEQLDDLDAALDDPKIKVAGIVIETVDDFVHGAVLGKRGIAAQLIDWCETGFVEQLFAMLLEHGFHVYVTSDHGNIDAVGQGRPNQGAASELRGERVRIYNSDLLADEVCSQGRDAFRLKVPALPAEYIPAFAGGRTAFVNKGEQLVAHGGVSTQEMIVPFVKLNLVK